MSALVLRDCHVLDGLGGPAIEAELWIASGRIVEPGTAPVAQTERLQGKVVTPGLIDAHVHLCFCAEPDPLTAYRRTTPDALVAAMRRNAEATLQAGRWVIRPIT